MAYPLEGIKVIDFSRVLAGPFAGRMLADLGADVVKVEPPEKDMTRHWGRKIHYQSGFFNQQNAGKRGISINLEEPDGVKLIHEMACHADVMIENFRPGVMQRLQLDWPTLHALNPRLTLCSISGFGQTGPERNRAAYAPIIHAESGLIARQAKVVGKPLDIEMSVADTNAGLHGLVGLLSALIMRQTTGVGQHVDIAMLDAMVATDDNIQYSLDLAEDTKPMGSEVWNTGVGFIMIAGDFRHVWKCLVEKMGVKDPTPKGASLPEKIRLRRKTVTKYFMNINEKSTLIATLDKMNLAWGEVREGTTLHEQPTLKAHNIIVQVDDRYGGTRSVVQSPYRFSDAECGVRSGSPRFGEHNAEVLREWLGYTPEAVQQLEEKNVLLRDEENKS